MSLLLIIIVLLAVAVVFVIATYNSLVVKRNRVRNGWHQIDVQLKRRTDLIPNLVETVKGYAGHEQEVFDRVTRARAAVMGAHGPAEAAAADGALTQTLKTLFAVAENYPVLKANENFLKLQEELTATENKISFARQFYNDVVMDFNNRIQVFPSNVIAGMFRFEAAEFYNIPEADREVPKVKF
ncbi:MAG: LemA family protein [bacterium]